MQQQHPRPAALAVVASLALIGLSGYFPPGPAMAAPTERVPLPEKPETRSQGEVCPGAALPDPAAPPGSIFEVTLPGDDAGNPTEGTLRWAVAGAESNPGLDTVRIAPGVEVQLTETIQALEGFVLLGEPGSSSIRMDGAGTALEVHGNGAQPSFFVMDGVSVSSQNPEASGLVIAGTFCQVSVTNAAFTNLAEQAIQVYWGIMDEFIVRNSSFSGTHGEYDDMNAAITIRNAGGNLGIEIRDSTFLNNPIGAIALESVDPPDHKQVVLSGVTVSGNGLPGCDIGGMEAGGVTLRMLETNDTRTEAMVRVERSLFQNNSGPSAAAFGVWGVGLGHDDASEADPAEAVTAFEVVDSSFVDNIVTCEVDEYSTLPAANAFSLAQFDRWVEGTQLRALEVTNSTFVSPVSDDAAVPSIAVQGSAAEIALSHVTLSGTGIGFHNAEEGSELSVRHSVFDTGDAQPVRVSEDDGEIELVLPVRETRSAFTVTPELLPASPERIVASSSEVALGALTAERGPTPVRVPGAGSVLIDAAETSTVGTDQRGLSRPQGSAPDIGAVEKTLPGTVAVAEGPQRVPAGTEAVFTVIRELDAAADPAPASVRVRTVDGSALAGREYEAVDRVLTWDAGNTEPQTVTVRTTPTQNVDRESTFTVELSEPAIEGVIITRATESGTITDTFVDPGESDADGGQADGDAGQIDGAADGADADGAESPAPHPTATTAPGKTPLAETGADSGSLGVLLGAAGVVLLGASLLLGRRLRLNK